MPKNSKSPFRYSKPTNEAVNSPERFSYKSWFRGRDDSIELEGDADRFYYNFGVLTGEPSNLTIIDSDGTNGAFNISVVEEIVGAPLPKTITVTTPNNGKHYYYKYTPLLPNGRLDRLNIDIKSHPSSYVIAASSQMIGKEYAFFCKNTGEHVDITTQTGRKVERIPIYYKTEYEFVPGHSFDDIEMVDLPLIYIQTLLFYQHHYSRINDWDMFLLMPVEERHHHISEWYQEHMAKLPTKAPAGIRSQRQKKLNSRLSEITQLSLDAFNNNAHDAQKNELLDTVFKTIEEVKTSKMPAKVQEYLDTVRSNNTTFSSSTTFPTNLIRLLPSPNEPPKKTLQEKLPGEKLYKWSPFNMIEGDGRNCMMTSVIGLLWWFLGSNAAFLPLLWDWAQLCNRRFYEPLDNKELLKIYISVTKYKQYPKGKLSDSPRTPRPHNNITVFDEESQILQIAVFKAIVDGQLEWVASDEYGSEPPFVEYPDLYRYILLPALKQLHPSYRYEDITRSQKAKFIHACKKLFQKSWKTRSRIFHHGIDVSIQVGIRLNVSKEPRETAKGRGTSANGRSSVAHCQCSVVNCTCSIAHCQCSAANCSCSVAHCQCSVPNCPSSVAFLSPKEWERLLGKNKEVLRWKKRREQQHPPRQQGLYGSSEVERPRVRLKWVYDWKGEAIKIHRHYMEWRFGYIVPEFEWLAAE